MPAKSAPIAPSAGASVSNDLPPEPPKDIEQPPMPDNDPIDTNLDFSSDVPQEGDQEGGDDSTKEIQSLTGQLAQKIREKGGIDSKMIKYIMNSITSAVDVTSISPEDRDDIIRKLSKNDQADSSDSDQSSNEQPFIDNATSTGPAPVTQGKKPDFALNEESSEPVSIDGNPLINEIEKEINIKLDLSNPLHLLYLGEALNCFINTCKQDGVNIDKQVMDNIEILRNYPAISKYMNNDMLDSYDLEDTSYKIYNALEVINTHNNTIVNTLNELSDKLGIKKITIK